MEVGTTHMVMDAKDIQSDLHALKKLYGLVKKDGDGTSNTATDLLDEHARVLLKNLLDAATKRVLKLHSEIIAGQVEEASRTHSPTHLQQPDESSNEQPTPPSKPSIIAESSQRCEKEIMESNKDTKPDGLDIAFWKEKRFGGVEHRKKRCRLCQRNTKTRFYDDAQNSKISTDVVAKVCNSDSEATTKPEEVDSLSKEASKAIEQIELCISSFHIGADHLHDLPSLTAEEINRMYWLSNQTSKPVRPTKAVLRGSTDNFVSICLGLGSEESIEESIFLAKMSRPL
ncbi:hypothetical protein DH2020_012599 [Rehmannia glutinosa]|uniref:Uncharacterized protein n=1 Tax=Rehmannia glutinosa TaxID=99300 RepID=A0ABR0X0F7_REHGL